MFGMARPTVRDIWLALIALTLSFAFGNWLSHYASGFDGQAIIAILVAATVTLAVFYHGQVLARRPRFVRWYRAFVVLIVPLFALQTLLVPPGVSANIYGTAIVLVASSLGAIVVVHRDIDQRLWRRLRSIW